MIKVGIIGATGYAGGELVRILMGHKEAEIVWYGSRSYIDRSMQMYIAICFNCRCKNAWMTISKHWQIR